MYALDRMYTTRCSAQSLSSVDNISHTLIKVMIIEQISWALKQA